MNAADRIICALDVDTEARALELTRQLRDHVGVFKVGLELATSAGVGIIQRLRAAGAERVFYDAKLHDIPNTVAGAMRAVVRLGVWSVTLHAAGGVDMLRAAREAAEEEAARRTAPRPLLLAVTVLTSIGADMLRDELQVVVPLTDHVVHLARLARRAGCDGVIASPHEVEAVRRAIPDPDFLLVTPGVRPAGHAAGDQARVLTPGEAIRRGADYLVIGRPIAAAEDPAGAARRIIGEIDADMAPAGPHG